MPSLNQYPRHHVNIRHLRVTVALDDRRNVGPVAAYLNVTRTAVSKTLATLESGLGVQLFSRGRRGMEPTDAGACLVRHAREILSRLNEAGGAQRASAGGAGGYREQGRRPKRDHRWGRPHSGLCEPNSSTRVSRSTFGASRRGVAPDSSSVSL